MAKFIVHGGNVLKGKIRIQGAKNAAQKIIPSTILFPGKYTLNNVPVIEDSKALLEIVAFLGGKVDFHEVHSVTIDTTSVEAKELPPEMTARSTGSFLFAGALLGRFGRVKIWHPGGDKIGKRPITWHLDSFRKLGATVTENPSFYEVSANELMGSNFTFSRTTVNGTVNAILASTRAKGLSIIDNAALEPEIDNFIEFMRIAGANVERVEGKQVRILGTDEGTGRGEIEIIPDRNDAATFAILGALTHGPLDLVGVNDAHLSPLTSALKKAGVTCTYQPGDGKSLTLRISSDEFQPIGWAVTSRPYPGFSTDWGPMTQVLMTQVPALSVFHETIFAQRFSHLSYLEDMGANITYFNPQIDTGSYNFEVDPNSNLFHAVQIKGKTKLVGIPTVANDVRAGAALVIAGLIAEGVSEVDNILQIDRGYEAFEDRLKEIGANIERVEA